MERSSKINFLITEKLREEVLERKKAKDNITRRARWAEGLQKASQDLSLCRHIEEIARVTSRSVVEQLGLTNAWVGVHSQDGSIQPLSVYGGSGNLIQKEGENCQIKVVRTGQSIVISDVEADPPFENCPAYAEQCHFGSCATFPISAGEKCVGTLTIRSPEKGDLAGVVQIAPMIETLVQQVGHVWQRCLAEENLKKLSRAIESSPVSVVITDTHGTIEYVNSKFNEVTGYTVEEAIGQNSRVFKSGDLPKSYYKELWDTILSGKVWRGRFINKRKNGEDFWESASISPIMDEEGEITHFVAVKQDITERKHMEQEILAAKEKAEEATRAKSDFLANMSHEIRTPMNAVIGMSHLALKTELTPKQQDYLNKIQSSANSLLGIINDILDFSKIEAGKLDMESTEFNLDDLLDNLANLVTVKAQEKEDLEVLFATASEVSRFLVGDPLRLGQVLINLANNAVKFTESGEIVVSTELLELAETGLTIKFSVRDTGIGLTKEQISKLFQSFSQADTSTTRKFGGTGLGLTISKQLVEMMGGEIWVESEPGQGTTFSFTANLGLERKGLKNVLYRRRTCEG